MELLVSFGADVGMIGKSLAETYVAAGLVSSKTEFRKLVRNGGVMVDSVRITDQHARIIYGEDGQWYVVETRRVAQPV